MSFSRTHLWISQVCGSCTELSFQVFLDSRRQVQSKPLHPPNIICPVVACRPLSGWAFSRCRLHGDRPVRRWPLGSWPVVHSIMSQHFEMLRVRQKAFFRDSSVPIQPACCCCCRVRKAGCYYCSGWHESGCFTGLDEFNLDCMGS